MSSLQDDDIPERKRPHLEELLPTTTNIATRKAASCDVSSGLSPPATDNDANADPVTDTQPNAEHVVNKQRVDDDNNRIVATIAPHQDDVFTYLIPQNMVGTDSSSNSSIMLCLQEMVPSL
jgi:hypothetical protein